VSRSDGAPSRVVVDEAAAWLVKAEERPLTPAEQAELEAWRGQSHQHERAWQAAIRLKGLMSTLPARLGKRVLGRPRKDRRALIKALAGLAVLGPAAKLTWDEWPALTADYRTAAGEQRRVTLSDGSGLQLNTATAVSIRFSPGQRLITLVEGEVFVTTASGSGAAPPFLVDTTAGRIRALGTRFSVRATGRGVSRVAVYEHAVALAPALARAETRLAAGRAAEFDRRVVESAKPVSEPAPAWTRGQIISDNQRLGDLIAELARYRPGILRYDPAVAELRISGVFQLEDTNQALDIIAGTLPVRISRVTDYWVTVTQR